MISHDPTSCTVLVVATDALTLLWMNEQMLQLIGAYTLSNWYEDYSDFTTIDMMAGDDVLDELMAAMDDIESGD